MAISETICNFPVHKSHLQHGFLIVILQFRIPDPFFARHLPSPCSLSVPIFFFQRLPNFFYSYVSANYKRYSSYKYVEVNGKFEVAPNLRLYIHVLCSSTC